MTANAATAVFVAAVAITVPIRGGGVRRSGGWQGVQNAGTAVVQVFNPDWPTDLSVVAKVAGGAALNTKTGITVAAGARVQSDGSVWKDLIAGTTY